MCVTTLDSAVLLTHTHGTAMVSTVLGVQSPMHGPTLRVSESPAAPPICSTVDKFPGKMSPIHISPCMSLLSSRCSSLQ
jgi:hypothetical protein